MRPSDYPDIRDLIAPSFLSQLEDLELVAQWVVEGFLHGLHRSPYVGFSVEFASHRQYLPGDDLRHLNWKLYGRHDKLYVKQYDAETNVDVHLVLDVSRSMTAGQDEVNKLHYGSMLCAALAYLAVRQRDAVGLTLFADRVLDHVQPRGNPDHRTEILQRVAQVREHPVAESPRALHEVAELMPRRGLVVVISDLYFDVEELLAALGHFRHYGHDVLLFHVLTPIEQGMNVDGAVRFRDLETGEQVTTQAHEIRKSFVEAVTRWMATLRQGCDGREVSYAPMRTETPLEAALNSYFCTRAQLF